MVYIRVGVVISFTLTAPPVYNRIKLAKRQRAVLTANNLELHKGKNRHIDKTVIGRDDRL